MVHRCFLLVLCALATLPAIARPLTVEQVPEPLRTWIPWVLQGSEQTRCPFLYQDQASRLCAWPGRLELRLDARGGSFQLHWRTYAAGLVPLPGDSRLWPQAVQVDGKPAAVLERNGRPAVDLAPGSHTVAGSFFWEQLPDSLPLPEEMGLVALNLAGKPVMRPNRDAEGRLWLRGEAGDQSAPADQLHLRVFRHVDDATPLVLTTRLLLDVAGRARELDLGRPLPEGLLPLSLSSGLPARLEQDGTLRVQVRPGRWQLDLTARGTAPLDALARPASAAPWPADEIWSFQAHSDQRLVEVEGAPALDPSQAEVPEAWRGLPAYRLERGGVLRLRTVRRGDPEPEPDALSLHRQLWLDFNGEGYTFSDAVSGRLSRAWRLEAGPGFQLGRVAVDGQPRLITLLSGSEQPGVELRHGQLNLTADGRLGGDIGRIPVTGWTHGFDRAQVQLHLPPGWRLLGAAGVDNVPETWIGRWTLLDFFAVLMLALAVGKLWGRVWALPALACMAMLWHEPAAPRFVWLHLVAAVALLRVLPPGRFQIAVLWYRNLSWLALAVIALPFMIDQVRQGFYPQLELPRFGQAGAPAAALLRKAPDMEAAGDLAGRPQEALAAMAAEEKAEEAPAELPEYDPEARIQTGRGVPDWRWRGVQLSWNGPVRPGQTARLYLLPPGGTLLANLLRVALIGVLAARLADWRGPWGSGRGLPAGTAVLWLLSLLAAPPARAGLPDDTRLDQLRERLLEPPECLPRCAELAALRLEAQGERLALLLEWHAAQPVAVPLPALRGEWLPDSVTLDGKADQGVAGRGGAELWLDLPAGVHMVILEGRMPSADVVRLPLAARPHRATAQAEGWQVEGIGSDGQVESQLRLIRQDVRRGGPAGLPPLSAPLPPFVQVERQLELGLDWRVHTRLQRLSPPGTAVALEIPLLAGESVTTPGLAVSGGTLSASLLPRQNLLEWDSVLERRTPLALVAPVTTAWHEVWELRASPVWHVEWQGIAPVHHQSGRGLWAPRWYPWPGEKVVLQVGRPRAVAGPTLTLDGSQLRVRPGAAATDATLELSLRSSLGGPHKLTLPERASLQTVWIDGTLQPARAKGREVVLPLRPGVHNIRLEWQQPAESGVWYRLPAVDLGSDSVNARFSLQLGEDRWLLLAGGPRLGPAVLFWGALLVLAFAAALLGRLRLTPLRARHWLLLLVGFSQSSIYLGLLVVGWLLALGWRARWPDTGRRLFNAGQVGLALYTLLALGLLFHAVSEGLLGRPDMQVTGHASTPYLLQWYQDRSGPQLPQPWIVSLPLYGYRFLMLGWALWLAWALLDWLRWGWGCFTVGGLWRARRKIQVPETESK